MHRTHVSGLLGILVAPAFALFWPLGLVLLAGVVATRALTGAVAALVGLIVLHPSWTGPLLVLAVIAVGVRHYVPPGSIIDTTRARLLSWLYLLRHLTWVGHGPGSVRLALEAAHLRTGGRAMDGGPARNEWLELLYEYGLFAAAAFGLLAWWLLPHWRWGDPGTATTASVLAICSVTSPVRALWKWLAGDRLTLFDPPLRASLSVHLDQKGDIAIYGPRVEERSQQVNVAIALALALTWWQTTYNVTSEEIEDAGRATLRR